MTETEQSARVCEFLEQVTRPHPWFPWLYLHTVERCGRTMIANKQGLYYCPRHDVVPPIKDKK